MNTDKTIALFGKRKTVLTVMGVLFCISFLFWILSFPGKRYVFLFQSADTNELSMEVRYLHFYSGQNRLNAFVDELLLGPGTEHFRPLFTPGTGAAFCFVRKRILYVELTHELLQEGGGASAIRLGVDIFKKNIMKNFRNIKEIELFSDGKRMYGDN